MKKITYTLLIISANIFAQSSSLELIDKTSFTNHFIFNLGELKLNKIEYRGDVYTQINMEGMTKSYDIGNPDLPVFTKLIEVPEKGEISIQVNNKDQQEVDLALLGYSNEVFPSQPSLNKKIQSSNARFSKNEEVYLTDTYYAQEIVSVVRLGKMRGKSIARLQIAPFSYNPITSSFIEVKNINFNLTFSMPIKELNKSYYTKSFESHFSKLANVNVLEKNNFSNSPIRMIILSDPIFEETLQDFIQWKKRKGIEIIEVYKGQDGVGSSASSMKAYIQDIYESATEDNPAPEYLLIVGDHEQIPGFQMGQGNWGGHISDMVYCEFDGNGDYFPEMFYGRFSANSISELLPQIEKTIQYEQYTMPDPSYLDEVVMVAGVDAGMAPTYGNGQINYGTDYYFNQDHGLISHTFLYPASATSISEEAIIEHISQGVGFANYTAHCGPAGWSDPAFEIYDINYLQNEDEYGLLIGNCCQSNVFDGTTCFGEALLRSEKKGAVGYIGATNNTYWDEDFFWSVGNGPISVNPSYESSDLGIYDCSFHENGELEEDWTITQGQILHAGNWAVSESNGSDQYYWEIYMLMGDPTVLTYYGRPSTIEVTHPEVLPLGVSSLTVTTEQYTYVAINQSGILLDASYTDASGNVILSFDPLNSMDPLEIVASKQNKQVYISEINLIASDAPFIVFSDFFINDGEDGNEQAESGETFNMDVTLQNFGSVSADSLQMTVSSPNSNVIIYSSPVYIENIAGEELITIIDAVTLELEGLFQDQDQVQLTFNIIDEEGNAWQSNGSILVNAPLLDISSHTIDDTDQNGFIDFGELVNINFDVQNIGHAHSSGGVATLSSNFSDLQIIDNDIPFNSINQNQQTVISFPLLLNDSAQTGESYELTLTVTNEQGYSDIYIVDFETSSCSLGSMGIELNLVTDWYADEISWELTDIYGVTLGSAQFNSLNSQTEYLDLFCVSPNTYMTFSILDDYGDGLLSEGYSIIVCGEIVASGSDYGDGETISFIAGCDQFMNIGCTDVEAINYDTDAEVDDGSCEFNDFGFDVLNNSILVYPNPAINSLNIRTYGIYLESLSVIDLAGKKLISVSNIYSDKQEINVKSLEAGTYFIQANIANGRTIIKSLIIH